MFVKIYFYKLAFTLKHYKLMWQYLARNLKADLNILVLLTYVFTEIGAVTQCSFYRDLFNQNGVDFATEISLCKTPVVDEKMSILQ